MGVRKSPYEFALLIGRSETYFYAKLKTGKVPIHYRFFVWEGGNAMIDVSLYKKFKAEFDAMVDQAQQLFYVLDETELLDVVKEKAFYKAMSYEELVTKVFFFQDNAAFLDEFKYLNIRKFILAAGDVLQQAAAHGA